MPACNLGSLVDENTVYLYRKNCSKNLHSTLNKEIKNMDLKKSLSLKWIGLEDSRDFLNLTV